MASPEPKKIQEVAAMKNIWLNILAFVAFLAIEIVAVSFMSAYSAGSAAMALLGVLALVIGGIYTVLLGRDIVSIRR
jgi:hypothetical protein